MSSPVNARPPMVRFGLRVMKEVDKRVVLALALAAVAADFGLRGPLHSFGGTLTFALVALALVVSGRVRTRSSLACLALAVVFAVFLGVRASAWVLVFDVLAILLLLTVSVGLATGGRAFDAGVPTWLLRLSSTALHVVMAPAFVLKPLTRMTSGRLARFKPVLVGLLIIVPVFLLMLALLASADAVFASLIDFDVEVGDLFLHVVLLVMGAWFAGGLVASASAEQARFERPIRWRLGATEANVGIGALVALLGVFVATQLVVWAGGADAVLQSAGVTYAEHARNGYFQLLVVAALVMAVVMLQRSVIEKSDARRLRLFRLLSVTLITITLALLGSALHRLSMYEAAYGLTMLRLYSSVFAVLLAAVLVLLAIRVVGVGEERQWFPAAAVSTALVVLLGLNIVNVEAMVVERNLARRSDSTVPFDAAYAATLTDGLPTLIAALRPDAQVDGNHPALSVICPKDNWRNADEDFPSDHKQPWYRINLGRADAARLIERECPAHGYGPPNMVISG